MRNRDNTKKTTRAIQCLARQMGLHCLCEGGTAVGEDVAESVGARKTHKHEAVSVVLRRAGKRDRKLEMILAQSVKCFGCPTNRPALEKPEAGLRI